MLRLAQSRLLGDRYARPGRVQRLRVVELAFRKAEIDEGRFDSVDLHRCPIKIWRVGVMVSALLIVQAMVVVSPGGGEETDKVPRVIMFLRDFHHHRSHIDGGWLGWDLRWQFVFRSQLIGSHCILTIFRVLLCRLMRMLIVCKMSFYLLCTA